MSFKECFIHRVEMYGFNFELTTINLRFARLIKNSRRMGSKSFDDRSLMAAQAVFLQLYHIVMYVA